MKNEIIVFGIYNHCLLRVAEMLWHMVSYNTIWNRIYRTERVRNYDVELLVTVPDLRGVALQIIGLDGQARYKVPWSSDLKTTREILAHERPDLLELYCKSNPTGQWHPFEAARLREKSMGEIKECRDLLYEIYQKWLEEREIHDMMATDKAAE